MGSDLELRLLLNLTSGSQLMATSLMLFPEWEIRHAQSLRAAAQEELGGFSTGLGFWGSPGYVVAGAAILGIVESLVSNSKTKKGLEMLAQAAATYEQARGHGAHFAISEVNGIDRPHPTVWRATKTTQVIVKDVQAMGVSKFGQFLRQYNISKENITNGIAAFTGTFIHNEDEFVSIKVDDQSVAVRWSEIASYQLCSVCPSCTKSVDGNAGTCKHCGHDFYAAQKSMLVSEEERLAAERRTMELARKGKCPQCKTVIILTSETCPKCGADFTHPQGWKVLPLQ